MMLTVADCVHSFFELSWPQTIKPSTISLSVRLCLHKKWFADVCLAAQ